ncbi:methyl-CpG-binding domain protein 1b isoform X2 [Alosa pseudoharengus]|uniref:methyl-CpG-binding domain protein 1b isoform X2 n=1 Tax=Alosa pseudoharengus TaxID=34774 RepID=UPI003F887D75
MDEGVLTKASQEGGAVEHTEKAAAPPHTPEEVPLEAPPPHTHTHTPEEGPVEAPPTHTHTPKEVPLEASGAAGDMGSPEVLESGAGGPAAKSPPLGQESGAGGHESGAGGHESGAGGQESGAGEQESGAGGPVGVNPPPLGQHGPDEPPGDWLEPLEEDDLEEEEDETQSWGQTGSREGSVSGVERSTSGRGRGRRYRPRVLVEEDWDDCPSLGEGWKRKEVFRRSGCYMGKSDTYYMSPTGVRVRSKVELAKCLARSVDLNTFDFKSGQFLSGQARKRGRRAKRSPSQDAGVSDDSSHPADDSRSRSPDSVHRVPPVGRPRALQQHKAPPRPDPSLAPLSPSSSPEPPHTDDTDTPDGSTNGASTATHTTCRKCGRGFDAASEGQTLCPRCKVAGKAQRNIVFRKWIPCGQCQACQTTTDCGACASCRTAQTNPDKPARCRKRKCLCPIRKTPFRHEAARASLAFTAGVFPDEQQMALGRGKRPLQDSDDSDEYLPQQDNDDDEEGEDDEYEDEDGELVKRKRRTCGKCEGCVVMRDCGTCDFCVDKPKFGGSNKKRQKCRLRQCTRQAMLGEELHSSRAGHSKRRRGHGSSREASWEFEFSDNENEERRSRAPRETMAYKTYSRQNPGRGTEETRSPLVSHTPIMSPHQTPRPSVGSGRQNSSNQLPQIARAPHARADGKKGAGSVSDIRERRGWSARDTVLSNQDGVGRVGDTVLTNQKDGLRHVEETALSNQDGQVGMQDEEEEDGIPMITQIFSLADSGVRLDGELLALLEALRSASLPQLWLPVLASGPVLQLLQCSKRSAMADTVVRIGPGLGFSVSVQDQPLLPTHPLYAQHPARLTAADQVVALLRDLEGHAVCQGLRSHAPAPPNEPLVNIRLATCHFLVPRSRIRCSKCRYPTEKN